MKKVKEKEKEKEEKEDEEEEVFCLREERKRSLLSVSLSLFHPAMQLRRRNDVTTVMQP